MNIWFWFYRQFANSMLWYQENLLIIEYHSIDVTIWYKFIYLVPQLVSNSSSANVVVNLS